MVPLVSRDRADCCDFFVKNFDGNDSILNGAAGSIKLLDGSGKILEGKIARRERVW